MDFSTVKDKLNEAGVVCERGLMGSEIHEAEEAFALQFPPDLKQFLMFVLPTGKGWPNWRSIKDPEIDRMLNWPYEGICSDIQHNAFWPADWGSQPGSLSDAFKFAKQKVDAAPKLIPIHGHRYLPDRPSVAGNPVFSVYQTDIIYYGSDLGNYFRNEFAYYFKVPEYQITEPVRRIEFWSEFVDGNY